MNNNILIAYFSRADQNYFGGKIVALPVGNTEVIMKKISEQIGGTLFKSILLKNIQWIIRSAQKKQKKN